jgi:N6-L-threonylcarbamoyladenine synthase
VVPELASRAHLEKIVPVVREACEQAGVAYADVDAIAVTQGPGLVGSLLVGVSYAKAMAWSLSKPLLGVNHLEGHIHAVLLEAAQQGELERIEFPLVTLVVSGGHTALYHVKREPLHPERREANREMERADAFRYTYKLLGHTVDDAAGEAYDKVAKLLALGYPGGPVIDRLACRGNPEAVRFTRPNIKRGRAYDFSFSGIKTAVVRLVERDGLRAEADGRRAAAGSRRLKSSVARTLNLLASFQRRGRGPHGAHAGSGDFEARAVFVSGGVAANSRLRKIFAEECAGRGLPVFFPSVPLSTDNAAMIAAAAYPRFLAGEFSGLDLNADPSLKLGS